MVLAEALLRVPDAATADRLIEDKLAGRDWSHPEHKGDTLLVSASAWTLGVTARLIQPGETPENIIESLAKRLGLPAVRAATRQAMRLLGSHFVLGQTIERGAGARATDPERAIRSTCWARARARRDDAERYFQSYARCDRQPSAKSSSATALPERPGISVKLSALCIRATRRCRASACCAN